MGRGALPGVAQDGGMMEGSTPADVWLVNVGGVLEQELAGDQGPLEWVGEKQTQRCSPVRSNIIQDIHH